MDFCDKLKKIKTTIEITDIPTCKDMPENTHKQYSSVSNIVYWKDLCREDRRVESASFNFVILWVSEFPMHKMWIYSALLGS